MPERIAGMTVKEAINILSKMPDKTLKIVLDCPYCGKANELTTVDECVTLSGPIVDIIKQTGDD